MVATKQKTALNSPGHEPPPWRLVPKLSLKLLAIQTGDTVMRAHAAITVASLVSLVSVTGVGASEEPKGKGKWPYAQDMEAFIQELDRSYPFFDLKGIRRDWEKTKKEVRDAVKTCENDQAFAELLIEVGECLRDAHLGPRGLKIEFPRRPPKYYPGISFLSATDGRVVVMAAREGIDPALKTGMVVTKIDGQDARKLLEEKAQAAWKTGGFFSSPQRARLYEFRIPLQGDKGETHRITILAGKKKKDLTLVAETEARGWPHTYNMPEGLVRVGRSCWYGKLASEVGYIYLRSVDPSVEEGIGAAVAAFPDLKGWIVDLRGNGGGGYGRTLQAKLGTLRKPVACLIDAGCMSAGETLARDIVHACDARLFGSKTGGASSAKRIWNFPSGMGSMSLPTRSRWGLGGRAIEFFGIDPHVKVEAVPEEVQKGANSCIVRAEEYITKRKQGKR